MPQGEQQPSIPAWAERERIQDLSWIVENLSLFWPVAQTAYDEYGRGAIVVDTSARPPAPHCEDVRAHPFDYFVQEEIEAAGGEHERRMVAHYDPTREMVTILLKAQDHWSSYRIGVPGHHSQRDAE